MHINGSTRVFLVLGDPVGQVRAPEVFNALFERHGVNAVLVPAQVAPADLPGFVRHVLRAGNIDGLWLTIPHKTPVIPLLDNCDALALAAGAVNAVRRTPDGRLEGALFDGLGFAKALGVFGVPVAGQRVLLVGAGGAGQAIAIALAVRGAAEVALADVMPGRADAVVRQLSTSGLPSLRAAASADPAGYDLVVNCTPLGLRGDDPLPFAPERLDAGASVVDILMKNQPTPLLRACRARGIAAFPGYEMMLQQVPEYLSFFGFDAIARAVAEEPQSLTDLIVA